jgi:amidase
LFRRPASDEADASVLAALEQAGRWLEAAGFRVEEAAPPHFDEAAELWRTLVMDNERRTGIPTIEACGDEALKTNVRFMLQGMGETDRNGYLEGLSRRHAIARVVPIPRRVPRAPVARFVAETGSCR